MFIFVSLLCCIIDLNRSFIRTVRLNAFFIFTIIILMILVYFIEFMIVLPAIYISFKGAYFFIWSLLRFINILFHSLSSIIHNENPFYRVIFSIYFRVQTQFYFFTVKTENTYWCIWWFRSWNVFPCFTWFLTNYQMNLSSITFISTYR